VLLVPKVSRSHLLPNALNGAAVISQATRVLGYGCASVDHSVLATQPRCNCTGWYNKLSPARNTDISTHDETVRDELHGRCYAVML
jgi:hypothetical protein